MEYTEKEIAALLEQEFPYASLRGGSLSRSYFWLDEKPIIIVFVGAHCKSTRLLNTAFFISDQVLACKSAKRRLIARVNTSTRLDHDHNSPREINMTASTRLQSKR